MVKAIDKSTNTETKFCISGFYGWVHGEALIESVCSQFGKGPYATKGRSIREEDVSTLFEYDKTKYKDEIYGWKYGETTTLDGNKAELVYHPTLNSNNMYIFNENRIPEAEKSSITITNTMYIIYSNAVKEKYPEGYDLIFNFNVGDNYIVNSRHTSYSATSSRIKLLDRDSQKYLRPVVHIDANAGITKDQTTGVWILN